MLKAKRKYVRVCKQCDGTKKYILLQSFQGKEYATPVRRTYCDDNGNTYDNRNHAMRTEAQKKTP